MHARLFKDPQITRQPVGFFEGIGVPVQNFLRKWGDGHLASRPIT
jgi:hypothetical protein